MIVTSDIHLTDNPADEYRWNFLVWLRAMISRYRVKDVVINGDLTESKDRHSSALVNRIVDELMLITQMDVAIHLLKGNHDFLYDKDNPFFRFFEQMTDSGIYYYNRAAVVTIPLSKSPTNITIECAMLPYTKDPDKDWDVPGAFDVAFTHQTFVGAIAENNAVIHGGIPINYFGSYTVPIISGDVHVPQVTRNVIYTGAPHPIDFGDTFKPRVLLLTAERDPFHVVSLAHPSIRKMNVEIIDPEELYEYGLEPNDQLKITYKLDRSELPEWSDRRRRINAIADDLNIVIHSLKLVELRPKTVGKRVKIPKQMTPEKVFQFFCEERRLDDPTIEAGQGILTELLASE